MSEQNLDRLLEVARHREGDPDLIWPAALAAIELLLWRDHAEQARELALETLAGLGEAGRLAAQTVPLTDALLTAAAQCGEDPTPILLKAADNLPADSVLGKQLHWIAGKLPGRDPREFGLDAQANLPRRPLRPREHTLTGRDLTALTPGERDGLWKACHHSGQHEIALRLLRETGDQPPRYAIATWLVGHLVRSGDLDTARSLLHHAGRLWRPSTLWDIVPYPMMVQPLQHAAVTDQLRDAVEDRIDISRVPGALP